MQITRFYAWKITHNVSFQRTPLDGSLSAELSLRSWLVESSFSFHSKVVE